MATRAEPVTFGPFAGGINNYSDASSIENNEATAIENFDLLFDGSLRSRPPMINTAGFTDRVGFSILGVYVSLAGKVYILFSSVDVVSHSDPRTSYYNVTDNVFGHVTSTIAATSIVKYQNKVWLVAPPGSVNPGGWWDGTTFTAVATMPKGDTATIYKERMFVGTGALDTSNPSRVYFSSAADPSAWNGADFFDVSNGDEQPLVKLYTHDNSIMIFKTQSTFAFGYESSPTKGQVQLVNNRVGVENKDCVAELDNNVYVIFDNMVYGIANWNWVNISEKMIFSPVSTAPSVTFDYSLSTLGNRIVARFLDTYYVFNTTVKAWTTWKSKLYPHKFYKLPVSDGVNKTATYYASVFNDRNVAGAAFTSAPLVKFKDEYTLTATETFDCLIRTKSYNMNNSFTYKRLMWWGLNVISRSNLLAKATPSVYGTVVRWNDPRISGLTWNQWAATGATWKNPISVDYNVADSASVNNRTQSKTFVRFIASLRFREIQFEIRSTVDGTTNTGPLQIQSILALVINRQLVPAKVS